MHFPGADCRITDNSILAVSVLFEIASDGTELLKAVIENIAQAIDPGSVTDTGPLDFAEVIEHVKASPLYNYVGSGTTPPCPVGVNFFVAQVPMNIDVETYLKLKIVLKFNSRYTQNALGEPNLLQLASKQAVADQCGMYRRDCRACATADPVIIGAT
jgi:carbonic anhydrase